ncbi:hypothetical protein BV360_05660 [Pseudomonas syringae pv. actinidiae]|uniref:Cellulose biosynthesis protein BcsQ n=1 Tax=Pseudomonas syringae pv. actinidiae TaxID=103796 RepID=A0AAN4Q751_PSESF|nr:hypothetical protein BV340_02325 [Pseudomonas syringae pv. actinidiae]OSN20621.1 hypothetical protein BV339_02310 [Pseudomonas syringae pv. actinidiae]OSN26706.1 hypothetical protein BV341_02307 [Pseudomonas syringae pv. actinidiae]OSN34878.1 hypothetical protein BV343_02461 [Pseudomonas syringae pv. actinidiae]OSN36417.1 hypothetical protein BV342_02445 [Pseudomonas syringae pv. actinidiae]
MLWRSSLRRAPTDLLSNGFGRTGGGRWDMPLPDADNIGESILPIRSESYVELTPLFRWAPVKTLAI